MCDEHLGNDRETWKTRVIANNMETYMSFSAGQLQFFDSFQFTNMPLEKLVETLSPEDFGYTSKGFPNSNEFARLKQKGVYMYDYMNNMERFHETSLPSKDQFFNKLSDKHISRKQYQHAQRVWNEFLCKTLEDYRDIYLKSNALLLAGFFEKFRITCLHNYRLDAKGEFGTYYRHKHV